MKYTIRFAKKEDLQQIIELCDAHAKFENCEYQKKNKKEDLTSLLFVKEPNIYCLVVEKKLEIIGYATYTFQYSTWKAKKYLYLDCLYLNENARGVNIGEKIIIKIIEEANKMECHFIEWQTPIENNRAIKFYNRIGGKSLNKKRFSLKIN